MYNLSDLRDCAFETFVTNLGKYNEGELVGEWVKFPITNEEMQEVFKRIGIGGRYEEWFITDYECHDPGIYDLLGEYESLSELNYLAGQIMELNESEEFWQAVLDLGEYTGSVKDLINLTENMDCFDYLSGVTSDSDLGYYWIEENGSGFVEVYDGKIENIPEEYRIQSPNRHIRTVAKVEQNRDFAR